MCNQHLEAPRAGFLSLATYDPPHGQLPITRRLRLEKAPGRPVRLESLFSVGRQARRLSLLERVRARLLGITRLERLQSCWLHAPFADERLGTPRIDGAPGAAAPSRRESIDVAVGVDGPPQTVDPSEAERFVDRFGPRDAGPAGTLLVKPDPELGFGPMMSLEPAAKLGGRGKEGRLHVIAAWLLAFRQRVWSRCSATPASSPLQAYLRQPPPIERACIPGDPRRRSRARSSQDSRARPAAAGQE